jgi:hypothetical protein
LCYGKDEIELIDTSRFWHDLEQRMRIIGALRDRGGQLLNEPVTWNCKDGGWPAPLLRPGRVSGRTCQLHRR